MVVGVGKARELKARDFVKLGGTAMGKIPAAADEATIIADLPGGAVKPDRIADLALGLQLRAYAFDRYKTKRKDGEERPAQVKVTIAVAQALRRPKRRSRRARAVADGVVIARDLVNEPANVLYPEEFARRTGSLKSWASLVDVLDVKEMKKLGMNALLGVGQGSAARKPHGHHALERRQDGAPHRSPSSARASVSIPAAFPSSRQPAWRI